MPRTVAKVRKKLTDAINSRRRGRSAMRSRKKGPRRVRRREEQCRHRRQKKRQEDPIDVYAHGALDLAGDVDGKPCCKLFHLTSDSVPPGE